MISSLTFLRLVIALELLHGLRKSPLFHLKSSIRYCAYPGHVAFIVDGNGRWAEQRGFPRAEGHRLGAGNSVEVVKRMFQLNVNYITLYLFSTENWARPRPEIHNIMYLLERYLTEFSDYLRENKVRVRAIGQLDRIPDSVRRTLYSSGHDPICKQSLSAESINYNTSRAQEDSKTLCLAISYGGRYDIVESCRQLARRVLTGDLDVDSIDEKIFSECTSTGQFGIPDPDIIVRTSGEFRLSNFLLWQAAYAEFFSVNKYWPDFTPDEAEDILRQYSRRQRRFGGIIADAPQS